MPRGMSFDAGWCPANGNWTASYAEVLRSKGVDMLRVPSSVADRTCVATTDEVYGSPTVMRLSARRGIGLACEAVSA